MLFSEKGKRQNPAKQAVLQTATASNMTVLYKKLFYRKLSEVNLLFE
jgi:hypothetical protein